ncbi:MAG: LptF/LptG family permease [Acidobacteria bacterium]|nr:LptF/LptG family permease [Acidobacteriota bacterium]
MLWRQVFLADLTPPDKRAGGATEQGEGPRVTVASEAVAIADPLTNRIQLSMLNGSSHEAGKDPTDYISSAFPRGDQTLEARPPDEVRARPYVEMDLGPLWNDAYRRPELDARARTAAKIELHQRLALPPACILLALVGIPLGVSVRKAGKSTAFVLTVFLAFLYYMGLISLIGLAREGTLSVELAAWTPNAILALAGLVMIARLEKPGEHDAIGAIRSWFEYHLRRLSKRLPRSMALFGNGGGMPRFPILPQLIDTYILTSFAFYFALLLVSFVLMAHVFFFFELLSDVIRNRIPMTRVLTYFFFLTPKLIYDTTPVSVLVAVLVTFGILTKQNEVTALKACGISLHRLAVPVLLISALLSAGLFAFDHYYVPEANRIQDAIRNEIKGRPVQTYLRPDRKWIMGQDWRIYYYRYFDQAENVMLGVSVYELDPKTFRLRRHISAERARWEPSLKSWIFQNGWTRDIDGVRVANFRQFQATTFPELGEPPSYFLKEVKLDKQMNFQELDAYIRELQQGGFDTVKLQVQFFKKFAVPLFALIMAMISAPFAFLTGNRGAMAGVGVSFGIAIAYWAVSQLFEQFGNVGQLPPAMAAWAPDALFALAGTYLLMRMRT